MLNEHAMVCILFPPYLCFPHNLIHISLRNTQIENTCIVFRSWHISSNTAFVFSCFAIVVLGVLYEWLRQAQGQFDVKIAATLSAQGKGKAAAARSGVSGSGRSTPEVDSEEAGLLTGVRNLKEHTT